MKIPIACKCGGVVGQCKCAKGRSCSNDDVRGKRYPNGWDAFARAFRQQHPLCENCLNEGRTTPATEVHHIVKVSVRPDLVFEERNLMAVCRPCHEVVENV